MQSQWSRRQLLRTATAIPLASIGATLIADRVPAAATASQSGATPAASPLPGNRIATRDFTVNLGDFTTKVQLTYPAAATTSAKRFPTIVLFHGTGPSDMDFTFTDPTTGKVTSTIFRDIATYLPTQGVAVARFNKHYINGPHDREGAAKYFANMTLARLRDDGEKVLAAVQQLPEVDSSRIALYGWSEGSVVASALAARNPEMAGVTLQGVVPGGWAETFRYQWDLAILYLQTVVDANADGMLTLDELKMLIEKPYSVLRWNAEFLTLDPNSSPQAPKISSRIDADHDGKISINGELEPAVDGILKNFDSTFPFYAGANALPTVEESLTQGQLPVLLLQGDNDANVDPAGADDVAHVISHAGNANVAVLHFPGLGHSLGPAKTVADDAFMPITQQPLADLAKWMGNLPAKTSGTTPRATPVASPAATPV